jgi:hypothetical protein
LEFIAVEGRGQLTDKVWDIQVDRPWTLSCACGCWCWHFGHKASLDHQLCDFLPRGKREKKMQDSAKKTRNSSSFSTSHGWKT